VNHFINVSCFSNIYLQTHHVSTTTRPFFHEPLVTRINRLSDCFRPENRIYALPKICDVPLQWGTTNAGKPNPHLHVCVDNDPVTIWMVGELAAFEYKDDSYPACGLSRTRVGIQPLLDSHATTANKLCQTFSSPVPSSSSLFSTDYSRELTVCRMVSSQ
jgi:hypothetical protein